MRGMSIAISCLMVMLLPCLVAADPIVLTFEGLKDSEQILEFYNGGTGSMGSSGTNYGISFSPNALALIDSDAGGGGNFGHEPSPSTIAFYLSGGAATMNVAAGFDTGFSFYYSAVNTPGVVRVYDGLNASGNVLATLNLPRTPSDGGDPTGSFSPFVQFGVSFSGVARSVDFGGTANQIGFDNITLGSATPGETSVPLPGVVWGALGLFGLAARKRLLCRR